MTGEKCCKILQRLTEDWSWIIKFADFGYPKGGRGGGIFLHDQQSKCVGLHFVA